MTTEWLLSSQTKPQILCSQLLKYVRMYALLLWQNLILLATEPSVPCAEASLSVLNFWYYSLITTQINIELSIELTN